MARTALQPADIAATRARLTAAATRLFARHGFEAVTMRAVAAELGVSAMTPYRYLAGKDELWAMVRADAFARFAQHLDGSRAGGGGAVGRLRRLKAAYLAFALAHPDQYRVMFELTAPVADARWPALEAASRRAFGCLLDAVTAGIAAGDLVGEPRDVAQLLWAQTHGLVSLHLAGQLSARALERLGRVDHELAGFRPVAARPRSRT
ncbi:MAG: TetR/AcrR family transcriptional regulator [Kofleriaceae bacterium]